MEEFLRKRITELRMRKQVSEYQMSYDLGQNRSYVQGISSGRALPSMRQFFNICDYFEITPLEFFDTENHNPTLMRKAQDAMKTLSDEDMLLLLGLIHRLQAKPHSGEPSTSNKTTRP